MVRWPPRRTKSKVLGSRNVAEEAETSGSSSEAGQS